MTVATCSLVSLRGALNVRQQSGRTIQVKPVAMPAKWTSLLTGLATCLKEKLFVPFATSPFIILYAVAGSAAASAIIALK
jgi:hypothetical protein